MLDGLVLLEQVLCTENCNRYSGGWYEDLGVGRNMRSSKSRYIILVLSTLYCLKGIAQYVENKSKQ